MKIEVNIEKKYAFLIVGVLIIATGLIMGYALLTPGVTPDPGHGVDQVSPPSGCSTGQFLQWTGTAWTCGSSNIDDGTWQRKIIGNGCIAGYYLQSVNTAGTPTCVPVSVAEVKCQWGSNSYSPGARCGSSCFTFNGIPNYCYREVCGNTGAWIHSTTQEYIAPC